MNNKTFYRYNCPENIPIFSSPKWLDFICRDQWDVALVKDAFNKIKASMPYVINDVKTPKKIVMPIYTKFLGPYYEIKKDKTNPYITEEISILERLLKQLPKTGYYRQSWHPEYLNYLPFLWENYKAEVKYCYIIKNNNTVESLWGGINTDTKRLIRKAQKSRFRVVQKNDPDEFFTIVDKVFSLQNVDNPYNKAFLEKLSVFISKNDCGKMYFALNAKEKNHACALILFDKNCYYLFAGGADPVNRSSGANALLIWEIIKKAVTNNRAFNFLGSSIKSKERFIRSFGGDIYPYLDIIRDKTVLSKVFRYVKSKT